MHIADLYCDRCARVREFEQPPCADGHGPDCDEWMCTTCGTAVLLPPLVVVHRRRRRPSTVRRKAA